MNKLRHPFHLVAGLLSALSVSVSPVLPFVSTLLFLTYEIDEDWHITDKAYLDIFEYMLAFFAGHRPPDLASPTIMRTLKVLGVVPDPEATQQ